MWLGCAKTPKENKMPDRQQKKNFVRGDFFGVEAELWRFTTRNVSQSEMVSILPDNHAPYDQRDGRSPSENPLAIFLAEGQIGKNQCHRKRQGEY